MLSLHYKKLSLDLLDSGKNKPPVECCPVSSWEDKHKSSEDGKLSIICSSKMLQVAEGSLQRLTQPWNAAEIRVSNRWQNPEKQPTIWYQQLCVEYTEFKRLIRSMLPQALPNHARLHAVGWFKTQLSSLKIQDFGQETKLMHICHSTSELKKAMSHPSSQGSRESQSAPANSQLSLCNRIFRDKKSLHRLHCWM